MERKSEISGRSYGAVCGGQLAVLPEHLGLSPAAGNRIHLFSSAKTTKIREQQRELNYQFKDMLDSLNVTLQAGYSVENAISLCARELERLYGRESRSYKRVERNGR